MSKSPTPWLDHAIAMLGQKEVRGAGDNPAILSCFADCGHPQVDHDETAWCAALVGACLTRAGYPTPPTATSLMARSYLSYGRKIEAPEVGAIAVWARGKPPSGHVNIVARVNGDGTVTCIDGNLGDKVAYSTRRADTALAFRMPVAATRRALIDAGSLEMVAASVLRRGSVAALGVGTSVTAVKEAMMAPPVPAVDSVVSAVAGSPTPLEMVEATIPPLDVQSITEQLTLFQGIVEAAGAVWHLVAANPWLSVACAGALFGTGVAAAIERHRIARAAAGAPVTAQT